MYQSLPFDASFFSLLLRIDQDLAQQARGGGCPWCGGVLPRASYRRKPRGGPAGLGREHAERFSFCCSVEGCRRRVTPASVRFLGRKVFFAVVVLLVPVLRDGPTPERLDRLEELFTREGASLFAQSLVREDHNRARARRAAGRRARHSGPPIHTGSPVPPPPRPATEAGPPPPPARGGPPR